MNKTTETDKKEIERKLITGQSFDLHNEDGSILHCISLSQKELFGKADTVMVSTDSITWIAHEASVFMEAVEKQTPIKVK